MLVNFTHNDPKIALKINEAVGPPYSLIERFKMAGIGSPKMRIIKSSIEIHNLLVLDQSTNTCNIELRPKGIIIGFQKRLETYALIIPYYKLSVYKGDINAYTFFKDHYLIKILATEKDKKIHMFVTKILAEKEKNRPTQLEDL